MRKTTKKVLATAMLFVLVAFLTGCEAAPVASTRQDVQNTLAIGNRQVETQPTPTDLGPSITRYGVLCDVGGVLHCYQRVA